MKEIEKLIDICNLFKLGQLSVEEFQKRIETVCLPDKCKNTLEKEQHNALNKLEEIIYSYAESQTQYAEEVADALIQAVILEQK